MVVILLLVALIGLYLHNRKLIRQQESALSSMQLCTTILTKQRDEKGREISSFRATQLTREQFDHIGDSTVKQLKTDLSYWKNLVSHTSIQFTTSDTVEVPVFDTVYKERDTAFYAKKFAYSDNYLTLNGILLANKVNLSYSVFNNVTIDYYWKRDGFFSRKYLAGTVTQDNPHTTTNRVIQFTVTAPPVPWYGKWWVHELIGIGVGSAMTYFILK